MADVRETIPVRRAPLSREAVVAAAIDFMDDQGPQRLTMRRVGQSLGVEAMSLYRYVNGREDLLEAVVDHLVGQIIVRRPDEAAAAQIGWQGFLQETAHSVRDLARAHPTIFPLVATRHPAAPWLRPPLRSLRVVEEFLTGLISRGFTDHQAVEAYRAFTSFLLGHLLLEAAASGAVTSPVEEPLDEGDAVMGGPDQDASVDAYPQVFRLRDQLSEDHTVSEFEKGLEALLDRLDLKVSQ